MTINGAVLSAMLWALVVQSPPPPEFPSIFSGTIDGRRVIAVEVRGAYYIGDLIDDLRPYATPDTTLIAYINHEAASETEPVVVYVDGENVQFAQNPRSSNEPPTFADAWRAASIVQRGERSGAICRDGSQTDITNNGACSFQGGVDRWLYEAVSISDAHRVVAAICNDYRLVAGNGGRCGESEVLTQVLARAYPPHLPADPSEEPEPEPEPPTVRSVAPLPEPALLPPTVNDSRVAWTERRNGEVGFDWTTWLTNPNDQPVRARVTVHLRDEADEIIHSDERVVALDAAGRGEFADQGTVEEEVAARGRRWTFDVALTDDDVALSDAELGTVELVVDQVVEEARITNTGATELDMNGWTLTSTAGGESFTFRFFKLAPGGSVTLTSGEGARSALPAIYLWMSSEVWADGVDAAELRDARGRLRARTHPDGSVAVVTGDGGRR
jgi:hypothetical protein